MISAPLRDKYKKHDISPSAREVSEIMPGERGTGEAANDLNASSHAKSKGK
jgi:hypothetical protein